MADQIITGNQTISGNETIGGNQTVNGSTSILGSLTISSDEIVNGNQIVHGNQIIDGSQTISGQVITSQYVSNNQTVSGNQVITADQVIQNNQTIIGTQTVVGEQVVTKGSLILGRFEAQQLMLLGNKVFIKKAKFVNSYPETDVDSINGVTIVPNQTTENYKLILPRVAPDTRSLLVANPTTTAREYALEWTSSFGNIIATREIFFEDFWINAPWSQKFNANTYVRIVTESEPASIQPSDRYLGLCEIQQKGTLLLKSNEEFSLSRLEPTFITFRVHPNTSNPGVIGNCFFGVLNYCGFTFEYTTGITEVFDFETGATMNVGVTTCVDPENGSAITVNEPSLFMKATGSSAKYKIDNKFYNLNIAFANNKIVLKINEKEISSIPFFVPSPTGQQNKSTVGVVSAGVQDVTDSGVPFYLDLIRISQTSNLDDVEFSSLI